MSRKIGTPLDAALLLLALTAFGLAALLIFAPLNWLVPAPPIPQAPTFQHWDTPAQQVALFDDFAVIAARPLFAEDRRPKAGTAASGDQIGGLRLLGTLILPEGSLAILGNSAGDVARLRVGESFGDWTVEVIAADQVTLSREGETADLPLRLPAE